MKTTAEWWVGWNVVDLEIVREGTVGVPGEGLDLKKKSSQISK